MKPNEIGVFKNPGGACPFALEMFEQMERQFDKLVAIGKDRKLQSVPTLQSAPRKLIVQKGPSTPVNGIVKVDFYGLLRFRFVEVTHRWHLVITSFELSNVLAQAGQYIAVPL